MADNPDAARVGAAGKAYVAPIGTVAPTAIRTYSAGPPVVYAPVAWGTGWKDLGLISDDGLSETSSEDRQEWKPWGYLAPVRTQITSETVTFKFTAWETNAEVLSLYHRVAKADMVASVGPVGTETEVHFDQSSRTSPDTRAFGFDVTDGDNHFRYVVPRGEVTERGDVTNKADEIIGYELTVTAYPGSDGVSIHRMFQAGISLA